MLISLSPVIGMESLDEEEIAHNLVMLHTKSAEEEIIEEHNEIDKSCWLCCFHKELEEVHPKHNHYRTEQVENPFIRCNPLREIWGELTCGIFGNRWHEMVLYDGQKMRRIDARDRWREEESTSIHRIYSNRREEGCRYGLGLFHWTCGMKEYFERCLCCGTETDENRLNIVKNRREEIVETTDCACISMGVGVCCRGFCDNPITGTLCCPLVTAFHIIQLPFIAFIDCIGLCTGGGREQSFSYDDDFQRSMQEQRRSQIQTSAIIANIQAEDRKRNETREKAEYERKQSILSDIRKGKYQYCPETERRKYYEATGHY